MEGDKSMITQLVHKGHTVDISDELSFKIAQLLWEDIQKEWGNVVDIPKETPNEQKEERVVKHTSDKQIPFSSKTEKKQYDVAWKLCKKYGVPYPEALKLKEETDKNFQHLTKVEEETIATVKNKQEDKPKQAFYVGAMVRQVKGDNPAFGTGVITKINPDGTMVVEFFKGKKVLPMDHFEFYKPQPKTEVTKA